MRFLANENVPLDAVQALQEAGHNVVWIRVSAPGKKDKDILEQAVIEERILVTLDKDFGELAFRYNLPSTCGIILIRITPFDSRKIAQLITAALIAYKEWEGHFSVIETNRIRIRPLKKR
jgi:predicted nuclease of predicted toxin-antitoxin system